MPPILEYFIEVVTLRGLDPFAYRFLGQAILYLVFVFLVYMSLIVPIVRFSLKEIKFPISWIRSYFVAAKSASFGLILALILGLGGLPAVLSLSSYASSFWGQDHYEAGTLLGLFISVLIVSAFLLFLEEIATGVAIVKFVASETRSNRLSWRRSFWVSLKANIFGFLWMILIMSIFGGLSFSILFASIGTLSAEAIAIGFLSIFAILIIASILASLAPTASIIKYLVEEISKTPKIQKKEAKASEATPILKRQIGTRPSQTLEKPGAYTQDKQSYSPKKVCGNCSFYLTGDCPRGYPRDDEVWRTQKPCDLFKS